MDSTFGVSWEPVAIGWVLESGIRHGRDSSRRGQGWTCGGSGRVKERWPPCEAILKTTQSLKSEFMVLGAFFVNLLILWRLYFRISLKEDWKKGSVQVHGATVPFHDCPNKVTTRNQPAAAGLIRLVPSFRGEYRSYGSLKVYYVTWNPELVTGRPAYQVSLFPLSPRRSVGGAPRSLPCSWGFSRHSQISQPRHWRICFYCNPIFLAASCHEVWQAEFHRFRTLPHRCPICSDFCCFRSVARVCSGQLNWPFLTLVTSNWSCFGMAWKNLGKAGLAVAGGIPDFGLGKRIEQSAVGPGFGRGASQMGDVWSIYWNVHPILIHLRWRNSVTL